ncbi:hypothetical protein KAFR_0G02270 [Kazachstania africana CBS 2517]|uniref:Ubiquitin-like protein ATG12 n=1 Tax=Kazachstania africana (strain ATCC 22294 / BCRC 22015 / CBS 2517 / CECT 1963 / NBRC 1671 / NRRL Y-8276) TaxID=1071382 RepID=H2AY11_KAZAF|nr:hypothetical protein KAFR_0G02270 [Kazachstania africana CBS 2517]CCF59261.1 hypothetical protein KAFR_0G02270 [Kazachstania africana CBS 2517]
MIQSESDSDTTENDSSVQSSEASLRNIGGIPARPTLNVLSDNEISHSFLLQNRLHDVNRRLSQLGLVSEDDSDDNKHSPYMRSSQYIRKVTPKEAVPQSQYKRVEQVSKIQIKFQPIGSIPSLRPSICKISYNQSFSMVIMFLKKKLNVENVYCYVNSSFAPSPQQIVGDLWTQFKVNNELIVNYCASVAFG